MRRGVPDEAWSSATSAICSTISRSEVCFGSAATLFHSAAAPLSSTVNRPNGSQENQRIRGGGQSRLAHTCDSLSESLRRHLIGREVARSRESCNFPRIWVICGTEKVATCVEMISLKACSAAEGSPTATNNCPEQTKRVVSHHRRTVFSHLNQLCFLLRTAANISAARGAKKAGRSELA
jgi:hypothetical protein